MTDGKGGADGTRPESRTATYPSEALLKGQSEVEIAHRGRRYVLRVTRQGKLILNRLREGSNERHDDS